MSEHKLNLSKEIRDKMREDFKKRKSIGTSASENIFWSAAKQGTFSIGRNQAKRDKRIGAVPDFIINSGGGHGA